MMLRGYININIRSMFVFCFEINMRLNFYCGKGIGFIETLISTCLDINVVNKPGSENPNCSYIKLLLKIVITQVIQCP